MTTSDRRVGFDAAGEQHDRRGQLRLQDDSCELERPGAPDGATAAWLDLDALPRGQYGPTADYGDG